MQLCCTACDVTAIVPADRRFGHVPRSISFIMRVSSDRGSIFPRTFGQAPVFGSGYKFIIDTSSIFLFSIILLKQVEKRFGKSVVHTSKCTPTFDATLGKAKCFEKLLVFKSFGCFIATKSDVKAWGGMSLSRRD